MKPFTSALRVTLICLTCSALSATLGYLHATLRHGSGTVMPAGATAAAEYFATCQSFSEVEDAKAQLDAVAIRWLVELRQRRYAWRRLSHSKTRLPLDGVRATEAMEDLRHAIAEFRGTGRDLALVKDLLSLLKGEELYDQWLEVYLRAVYEHPADSLASAFAPDAVSFAKTLGREAEVQAALRHVAEIPHEFAPKRQREAVAATHVQRKPLASVLPP
jgi:hypothetical protein